MDYGFGRWDEVYARLTLTTSENACTIFGLGFPLKDAINELEIDLVSEPGEESYRLKSR